MTEEEKRAHSDLTGKVVKATVRGAEALGRYDLAVYLALVKVPGDHPAPGPVIDLEAAEEAAEGEKDPQGLPRNPSE